MLKSISFTTLLEWIEYADLEPFDAPTAVLCSVIANCNRDTKSRPKPFTPKDFFMFGGNGREPEKKQSWATQKNLLRMVMLGESD